MDNVNRDISVKMLIEAAEQATSRQFILITPQSIGNIKHSKNIRIHKYDLQFPSVLGCLLIFRRMSDPERGQTALNIGTQATQA